MAKDKYADKAAARSHFRADDSFEQPAPKAAPVPPEPKDVPKDVPPKKDGETPPKAEKKGEAKGRAHIAAYVASAGTRHKNLPSELLDKMGSARTKGEAKRTLRNHLQKIEVVAQ